MTLIDREELSYKVRISVFWLLLIVAFFAYRTLAVSEGATEVSVLGSDELATYLPVAMSLSESTTTTEAVSTTSEASTTTTTLLPAEWTGSASCDLITLGFDPAEIEGIRVTMFLFGIEVPLNDLVTVPGEHPAAVGGTTLLRLEAVGRAGFDPVPDLIEVVVEPCPDTSTTVDPGSSTTVTTPDELPFTGSESGLLALAAVGAMILGGYLVRGRVTH
jgi:hypothetical protein